MQRGIATLLAIALVLWAVGAHMFNVAEASNLLGLKDTLSDSNPGSPSDHYIEFTAPNGVASGQTITVTFPNGFNLSTSSVEFGDIDLTVGGVDQTLVGAAPGAAEWLVTIASQVLTFTSGGAGAVVGSNASVTIAIGLNATGGNAQITNHTSTTTSYEFTVTSGTLDSGQARIAIVDNVLVTANVDTTLTFTISGTNPGTAVNGSATSTFGTSTNNTLPFGTLSPNVSKTLAQNLAVATNARNGYVVTVMEDHDLNSLTGADIDGFIDGSYEDNPTTWTGPSNNINDENTWGHWGLTSDDSTLLGYGLDFGADEWVSPSTTPRAIMAHSGPSDGVTDDIGAARVGYQIHITALQEASDDYSTTLTYVATPVF